MSRWQFFVTHRSDIFQATLTHLMLVSISMLIAIAIAVPLGMFIVRRPALRSIALGIAAFSRRSRALRSSAS
jgi:osmoprotectant transport system permease protein